VPSRCRTVGAGPPAGHCPGAGRSLRGAVCVQRSGGDGRRLLRAPIAAPASGPDLIWRRWDVPAATCLTSLRALPSLSYSDGPNRSRGSGQDFTTE
jgi:hypothetical protein